MRRVLRGALKILSAITNHTEVPKANLKPTLGTLCAIYGNLAFKFREEAWICLFNLLRSEACQDVGEILINQLLNRPNPSETRNLAKYRGSLLSIQRISEHIELTPSITPNLHLLLRGLEGAFLLESHSALDALETIHVMLLNDTIVELLEHEKWDMLRHQLDLQDRVLAQEDKTTDVTGTREDVTLSSPLHGFINAVITTSETPLNSKMAECVTRIVERIQYLMGHQWQSLNKERSLLITRFFLHTARVLPSTWIPAIKSVWAQGLLEPMNENWRPHLGMLVTIAASVPSDSEPAQPLISQIFSRVYPLLRNDPTRLRHYEHLLQMFCRTLRVQGPLETMMLQSLADLAAEIGPDIETNTFEELIATVEEALNVVGTDVKYSMSDLDTVPNSLVRLFLQCFQESFLKTSRIYEIIMRIASSSRSTNRRLLVMKLLTRLRCNSDYAIKVIPLAASDDLTENLCRPPATSTASETASVPSSRPSTYGHVEPLRTGRSSIMEGTTTRSRSATRSLHAKDRLQQVNPPQWMCNNLIYELPGEIPAAPSSAIYVQKSIDQDAHILELGPWLDLMIEILRGEDDWELYSYILVHLPAQLSNCSLFSNQVKSLQILHNTIVIQLNNGDFREPPKDSGIKKGDVALCLYQILIMLLPYHESFSRPMTHDTIRTFRMGIEKWERTGKCCIHALALCCYEIPSSVEKQIVGITEMMQKRITQADLAMDILEFLGCLSRLRLAYGEADAAFYRRIFAICIRYLQVAWEQRQKLAEPGKSRASTQFNRQSGNSGENVRTVSTVQSRESQGLSEYVYILAYRTIILWFLSIDVRERAQHVGWLTQELSWKDELGKDRMEEQSLVILDMMHRTAFSNLGETESGPDFVDSVDSSANIIKMWLVGMSIITIEVATDQQTGRSKCGQLTKRQASGTTHATYYHNTADLPSHHVQDDFELGRSHMQKPSDVYTDHMFLQMTSTIAPIPLPLQPIPLPDDDFTNRAIRIFDSTDTVDGHKAGVIYVGENQTIEADILANTRGSDDYEAFLDGLGTKVPLKGAKFNTQGLDWRTDEDGAYTYAWRDRITEIVFHVPTMMPTDLTDDPQGDKKKRHIGNDHIKIIFNASGEPFMFDTFASALNTVNIVITPEAHTSSAQRTKAKSNTGKTSDNRPVQDFSMTERFGFYTVQTQFSFAYPQFSSAAGMKIVSGDALSAFVRQIAITCSVFCKVWEDSIIRNGEYISSWRARLQEIIRLRKRYANTNTSANVHYPMSGADSTVQYAEGDTYTGVVTTGGMADSDKLLNSLDFTRWT